MDEIFDVVDEHDNVLEQLSRSEVHRRGLMHRAVHIFVLRSSGSLVIHKRAATKEEFPGVWTSSASGHVTSGEEYDTAASRELEEELGIRVELERLHKFPPVPETCLEHTVLYRAHSDEALVIDPVEIDAIAEVPVAQVQTSLREDPSAFSPAFCLLFKWFLEHADAT